MTDLLIAFATASAVLAIGKRVYDERQNRKKVADMRAASLRTLEMESIRDAGNEVAIESRNRQ